MFVRLLLITALFAALTVNAISLVTREDASVDLPNGSRCDTSAVCHSGYCGKSRCQAPKRDGEACYKNAGCTSNYCDRQTNTCAWQTAVELIDSTLAVPDSSPFIKSGPIFLGQATVRRFGSVDVRENLSNAKKVPRIAAELRATSTKPAVMRTVLHGPSSPEDDSGLFYRFRVDAFQSSRKGATCHLATNFNGKALSLPIFVDGVTKDFIVASYTLAPDASASSVSVLLRCDRFASATVLVSDLRIEGWKALSN